MRIIALFLIFTLVIPSAKCQNTDTWTTINIKDLGQIKMPPELEVQSGSYVEFAKKEMVKSGFDVSMLDLSSDNLIFQQKGLNENNKESYKTYARVMISTELSKGKRYGSCRDKLNLSQKDLADLNSFLKDNGEKELLSNTKLLKWEGVKEVSLNGMYCFSYSYERQIEDKPIVKVTYYCFQNKDRFHKVIISYRTSEIDQWKKTLDIMLSTLIIKENIKSNNNNGWSKGDLEVLRLKVLENNNFKQVADKYRFKLSDVADCYANTISTTFTKDEMYNQTKEVTEKAINIIKNCMSTEVYKH